MPAKSDPTAARTAYAGGMIPEAFRRAITNEARTQRPLLVRKMAVVVPMTAEMLAEGREYREGIELMHRLASGTATPEEKAAAAERAAAHKAEHAAKHAAAVAEWEAVRARYADSPAVLAVLDIHQVDDSFGELGCTHPISGWEAESEEWPCSTFEAIRDAPIGEQR